MQYKLCFYKLLLVLKWCYYFCLFWYFIVHTIIPLHSYKTFIHRHSPRILSIFSSLVSSVGKTYLGCWAKIWTRAFLTARTNRFTLEPGCTASAIGLKKNILVLLFTKKSPSSRTLGQLSKGGWLAAIFINSWPTGCEATPILLLCSDLICCTFSRFPLLNFQLL